MKKNSLLLIFGLFICLGMQGQTLVSTNPQLKNAVLEEYTGIHCTYCPDGHAIAASMIENNPGRVVVIALHQGSFANPGSGEPDYRTPWGDALAAQAGISSYPSGTINRHLFSGSATGMGRGDWISRADEIMQEISPVNVGISSEYNDVSRELTIQVELYYTDDSPEAINYLNVALLQSHIFGPQTGGGAGNNYEHMHMLRDLITGQWGEEITTTSQGTFIERTYVYEVPESFNDVPVVVEDCDVAVFVTESHQEIYSGDVVNAIGGTNMYIGDITLADEFNIKAGNPNTLLAFNFTINSILEGTEEFNLSLSSDNAPEDWDMSFEIDGETYDELAMIDLENNTEKEIIVYILPGNQAELVNYSLVMESVSYPNAPAKYCEFRLISGVTDLVVTATGGPEAIDFEHVYTDALEASGCVTYTSTMADVFVDGMTANAFSEVNSIYYNVSWTFPALTIGQIEAVKTFMDNGGSLLLAGQDIGWDMMSGASGSHSSPEATDFYENYLFSNYIDDGSTTNNKLIVNQNDDVYMDVEQSTVVDMFNGNMYPDQISAREGADEVFFYDEAQTKAAVVKVFTDEFQMIYFGIGFEMIGDVDVKNQIMDLTRQWFNLTLSTEEFEDAMAKLKISQNYPNPASKITTIDLQEMNTTADFILTDMTGKKVLSFQVEKGSKSILLNVSDLLPGTYFYHLIVNDQPGEAKKLMIIK
jgi:hypothetical protein